MNLPETGKTWNYNGLQYKRLGNRIFVIYSHRPMAVIVAYEILFDTVNVGWTCDKTDLQYWVELMDALCEQRKKETEE